MKITKQQILVLFDIAKSCLYFDIDQFGGYSKQDIMRLINDIIEQQDNLEFVEFKKDSTNSDDFWN